MFPTLWPHGSVNRPAQTHCQNVMLLKFFDMLGDGHFHGHALCTGGTVKTVHAFCMLHHILRIFRRRDRPAMAQDDHVIAHALGGIMNILNQLHSVVQLHDRFCANRTADGATAVCHHDIGACFRHAHGLVCVKRIRRGKQVHLMGNAHHFHFLVIPHAGLFEVGAHAAFKQADCREVLHARITDLFYFCRNSAYL